MTKKQKEVIVKALKSSLNVTDVKWRETHENAAWCYGYLEGAIKTIIRELEDNSSISE
jgi:hypothetical protein